jgi:RNA polymerase sigma-70 factor (ECF subfamily)
MQQVNLSKLSDRELVDLYLNDQKQLYFGMLYSRYADKVYGKCLSMLKDSMLAEDAAQEIFTKIFLKLATFNDKAKFSTWLYSITYNFCIDLIRKQKRQHNVLSADDENAAEIADHVEDISDSEFLELNLTKLGRALDEIPVDDKAILLMKYQQGIPIKELKEITGKSESALKMQLKRAKQKVKKYYDTIVVTIYIILDLLLK